MITVEKEVDNRVCAPRKPAKSTISIGQGVSIFHNGNLVKHLRIGINNTFLQTGRIQVEGTVGCLGWKGRLVYRIEIDRVRLPSGANVSLYGLRPV